LPANIFNVKNEGFLKEANGEENTQKKTESFEF